MTEVRTVTDVRNAAIMVAVVPVATVAVIATVVGRGLSLLASGLLRLLCVLGLLASRLLVVLRLRLALGLLGVLWLRPALCLLRVLWLRLVLCLLPFSSATAFFLLVFLCECRNCSPEK